MTKRNHCYCSQKLIPAYITFHKYSLLYTAMYTTAPTTLSCATALKNYLLIPLENPMKSNLTTAQKSAYCSLDL